MQVIVNTDHNITLDGDAIGAMEAKVQSSLSHHSARLTRVEVHLTDGSAGRSTGDDIRCKVEARPEGRNPEFVTATSSTVDSALSGALRTLNQVLESTFGKADSHKGASSMGGVEPR